MQTKGGSSITSFMGKQQDSKLLRGFAILIGGGSLILAFDGEAGISIPIGTLFLAYGFGGSKLLSKIGLGHYNEEEDKRDKRTNPPRESP